MIRTSVPLVTAEQGVALVNSGMSWPEAAGFVGVTQKKLRTAARLYRLERRAGRRTCNKPMRLKLPENPLDLGYLAGIFDGEGSISILFEYRSVRCLVINTDLALIEWLLTIGGTVKQRDPVDGELGKKTCYEWQLYARRDTLAFLETMLPLLRIKKVKAKLAIQALMDWIGDA